MTFQENEMDKSFFIVKEKRIVQRETEELPEN